MYLRLTAKRFTAYSQNAPRNTNNSNGACIFCKLLYHWWFELIWPGWYQFKGFWCAQLYSAIKLELLNMPFVASKLMLMKLKDQEFDWPHLYHILDYTDNWFEQDETCSCNEALLTEYILTQIVFRYSFTHAYVRGCKKVDEMSIQIIAVTLLRYT